MIRVQIRLAKCHLQNVSSRKNDARLCSLSTIERRKTFQPKKKSLKISARGYAFFSRNKCSHYEVRVLFGAEEKLKIFGRMDYVRGVGGLVTGGSRAHVSVFAEEKSIKINYACSRVFRVRIACNVTRTYVYRSTKKII